MESIFFYAKRGDTEALKELLSDGGSVFERDDDGCTAMHWCFDCENKNKRECLEILWVNGADLNAADCYGKAPIHHAVDTGELECLEWLIKHGVNVNSRDNKGWSPLHFAVNSGHLDRVNRLIECGAKLNEYDYSGKSPLSYAQRFGFSDIENALTSAIRLKLQQDEMEYQKKYNEHVEGFADPD